MVEVHVSVLGIIRKRNAYLCNFITVSIKKNCDSNYQISTRSLQFIGSFLSVRKRVIVSCVGEYKWRKTWPRRFHETGVFVYVEFAKPLFRLSYSVYGLVDITRICVFSWSGNAKCFYFSSSSWLFFATGPQNRVFLKTVEH